MSSSEWSSRSAIAADIDPTDTRTATTWNLKIAPHCERNPSFYTVEIKRPQT